MPGTPSTRDPPETDAPMLTNVTDREPAQAMDGVKEHPDQPRTPTTTTMRPLLETNAPLPHPTPTMPTETTIATEAEPAQPMDGVKEPPDDLHPKQPSI